VDSSFSHTHLDRYRFSGYPFDQWWLRFLMKPAGTIQGGVIVGCELMLKIE
jgi:hypothetical protein